MSPGRSFQDDLEGKGALPCVLARSLHPSDRQGWECRRAGSRGRPKRLQSGKGGAGGDSLPRGSLEAWGPPVSSHCHPSVWLCPEPPSRPTGRHRPPLGHTSPSLDSNEQVFRISTLKFFFFFFFLMLSYFFSAVLALQKKRVASSGNPHVPPRSFPHPWHLALISVARLFRVTCPCSVGPLCPRDCGENKRGLENI